MAFDVPEDAATKTDAGAAGAGAAQPETSDQPLSWAERGRLAGAGATFNFADEILGLIRGITSGDLTVEEAIEEERKLIDIARSKPGSLKYELGGAVLPGLLAVPFTGGASLPATVGRTAAIGAAQATAAAIGAEEGGIERVTEHPASLGGAVILGGVAGPLGQKAVKAAGALAAPARRLSSWLTRMAGGKLPRHIEAEVLRVIEEGGMTIDEVVERVGQGEIVPDMSEQAANALRAIYAKSGKGAQVIAETVKRRSETLRREAGETLREDLAPGATTPNVTRAVNQSIDDLKAAESKAYKNIFEMATPIGPKLNSRIEEILNINKKLLKDIRDHIELNELPPLFKIVKGEVKLLRSADLETAEVLRRTLMDGVLDNKGAKRNLFKNLERQLRDQIDEFSPDLKATRAQWAKIMNSKDAFEDGKRIFGQKIDDAENYIEDLIAKGDDEVLAAFRAGVASQLRQKSTKGAKLTLYKNLNDLDKSDRMILEKLYPGDALEDALQKIKLADQAARTEVRVLGGSPTAITLENVKRIGSASGLANLTQFATTGNPMALIRLISGHLGAASQNLSEAQLARAAQILISEEPNVVRRALKQPAAQKLLGTAIDKIYERLVAGGATSAAISSAKIPPEIPPVEQADVFIGDLIESINPLGRRKLENLQQ